MEQSRRHRSLRQPIILGTSPNPPSPNTNRPIQQRRPALIVAIPTAPGAPALLWVLMITSATNRTWPGDIPIADLQTAGLPAPSMVRIAKIATIEAQNAEPLGHLSLSNRPKITEALHNTLAQRD